MYFLLACFGALMEQPLVCLRVLIDMLLLDRVRLATQPPTSLSLEGILHTADPITNLLMVITSPTSSSPQNLTGTVHVIPISQLVSTPTILSLPTTSETSLSAPFSSALPSLSPLDIRALSAREEAAVRALQLKEQNKGPKGTTKEAQEIFDALARTMPIRWHGTAMLVSDSVLIDPPHRGGDCRNIAGEDGVALVRVRKVVSLNALPFLLSGRVCREHTTVLADDRYAP